jgi:hypothetical protein
MLNNYVIVLHLKIRNDFNTGTSKTVLVYVRLPITVLQYILIIQTCQYPTHYKTNNTIGFLAKSGFEWY